MHGLCHFSPLFLSLSLSSSFGSLFFRSERVLKSFWESLQFIVINIINEFISGGESQTHKNKWEFSINAVSERSLLAAAMYTALIGLIVFSTACYFHLMKNFISLSVPIPLFFTFLALSLAIFFCCWFFFGFLLSFLFVIIFTFHICECASCVLCSPTTNGTQGKTQNKQTHIHTLLGQQEAQNVFLLIKKFCRFKWFPLFPNKNTHVSVLASFVLLDVIYIYKESEW